MDNFNISSSAHDENYLIGMHSKDHQDLNFDRLLEDNLTFIGSINATNSTGVPYTRDEFLAKFEQLVLGLIFVLTLAGNFLVLLGIYFRNQKMTRMYYFILHLSIADLTTAFFNVLTQLFWEFTHRFQGGSVMCKFVKYSQILGPYSSSYILVMTALDRYQAICYPLSNCSWTAGRSKLMLGTAWTLSFLFCLPQLHIFNYQEVNPGVFDCWGTFQPYWGEKAYITWYCITVFIIPLIILIFAYSCITRVIWLNFSMKNAAFKEERPSKKSLKRGDSDDMDDDKIIEEKSFEENESPIFRERNKYSSEKHLNTRNHRSSILSHTVETNPAKHLEVCWHQRNEGAKTRMSLKISKTNILPLSHNHQCQSCSESQEGESNSDPASRTSYYDGQYLSNLQSYKNEDLSKQKQSLLPLSHESHVTIMSNGTGSTRGILSQDNKKNNDRRTKWRSMSARFKIPDPVWVTTQELEIDGFNGGDFGKKPSKQNLLSTFQRGNRTSRQPSKSPIVKKPSTFANNQAFIQPRTHSVKGISRAKIKTVKLTVTVICCYIICSTPFIAALLWSAYDPYAKEHPFFFGPTFTILTLLASLNSCVNAWIVLFFNPNLLQSIVRGTCRRGFAARDRQAGLNSMSVSQRRPQNNKNVLVATNSNQTTVSSVTGLSPLMSRFSKPENNISHRSYSGRETMELVPPVINTSKSGSLSTQEGRNGKMDRNGRDGQIPIETSFISN